MANVNDLIDAIAKLRWSASGEWSANLKPGECRALLAILPDDALVIKSLGGDVKDVKVGYNGEDDEQPS